MRFQNTDVWGLEHAIRGMRNPLESWDKSDSYMSDQGNYFLGENDKSLAQRLIRAGSEHRKFMRQIMVSVDMVAPLYVWKEYDTYKVGTTGNSTSTMHKLATTPITLDCFEIDDYEPDLEYDNDDFKCTVGNFKCTVGHDIAEYIIEQLEKLRRKYLETKDKRYWKELIRWLPDGWSQRRTLTMNYQNLYSMVRQRENHKLTEWHTFVDWVHTLPYADELIFLDK